VLDVLDAVLSLVEPGGDIDLETGLRAAASGTVVDHSGARPFDLEFDHDYLYGWVNDDRHVTAETGDPPSIRENFTLELIYAADSQGEQAASRRLRSVSEVIDAKAHEYLALIAANVAYGDAWQDLTGQINPDTIRGFNVRGVGLRLTGYRYKEAA